MFIIFDLSVAKCIMIFLYRCTSSLLNRVVKVFSNYVLKKFNGECSFFKKIVHSCDKHKLLACCIDFKNYSGSYTSAISINFNEFNILGNVYVYEIERSVNNKKVKPAP